MDIEASGGSRILMIPGRQSESEVICLSLISSPTILGTQTVLWWSMHQVMNSCVSTSSLVEMKTEMVVAAWISGKEISFWKMPTDALSGWFIRMVLNARRNSGLVCTPPFYNKKTHRIGGLIFICKLKIRRLWQHGGWKRFSLCFLWRGEHCDQHDPWGRLVWHGGHHHDSWSRWSQDWGMKRE